VTEQRGTWPPILFSNPEGGSDGEYKAVIRLFKKHGWAKSFGGWIRERIDPDSRDEIMLEVDESLFVGIDEIRLYLLTRQRYRRNLPVLWIARGQKRAPGIPMRRSRYRRPQIIWPD
jgi:hypothetical protein